MPRFVRRKKSYALYNKPKRPIDKNIISVATQLDISAASTTVQGTPVTLAPQGGGGMTFPGTFTGLQWALDFITSSTAPTVLVAQYAWAIVRLRQGNSIQNIDLTSGNNFYTPEQDIIACGMGLSQPGTNSTHIEGKTKSMRKLMAGDKVQFRFTAIGSAVVVAGLTAFCAGEIQFFYRT